MPTSPQAIADLSTAALLVFIGTAFFGLLLRGILRFGREVLRAETSEEQWKAVAIKSTETASVQAQQISKLTDLVDTLSRQRTA